MIDMYNVNQDANKYFDYYKIKKGDNLYQIGKSYNVNPALIAILNGLNLNDYINLSVGEAYVLFKVKEKIYDLEQDFHQKRQSR